MEYKLYLKKLYIISFNKTRIQINVIKNSLNKNIINKLRYSYLTLKQFRIPKLITNY